MSNEPFYLVCAIDRVFLPYESRRSKEDNIGVLVVALMIQNARKYLKKCQECVVEADTLGTLEYAMYRGSIAYAVVFSLGSLLSMQLEQSAQRKIWTPITETQFLNERVAGLTIDKDRTRVFADKKIKTQFLGSVRSGYLRTEYETPILTMEDCL